MQTRTCVSSIYIEDHTPATPYIALEALGTARGLTRNQSILIRQMELKLLFLPDIGAGSRVKLGGVSSS